MKNIQEIKTDVTLEPFFLDYIRCEEEAADLPETMPEGLSEEETEKLMNLAFKVDMALDNLLEAINDRYDTDFDQDEIEDEDEIADILNDTCDYYVEKYSLEKILARPLVSMNDNSPDLIDFIKKNNLGLCDKCNVEQEEVNFEELPEEIKKEFDNVKEKAEHYLFCPECKEYTIINPN